MNMNKSICST